MASARALRCALGLWAALSPFLASAAQAGLRGSGQHRFGPFRRLLDSLTKEEEEEQTTPAPTWNGFPLYYEGRLPGSFANMSHMERQDFFFRMERWHERLQDAEKRRCRAPRPGEKVVYFVQHGEAIPKTDDAPLMQLGLAQSGNFRYDPQLARALSQDPRERAQLVVVSPARKALQTAVRGFAEVLPDATWEVDSDVRGYGWVEGTLIPQFGATALYELASNATFAQPSAALLAQYRQLPPEWHRSTKPHKDRWFDFVDRLRSRPEDRIIVVTHSGMIKQANITKSHSGEIQLAALLPDKTWRRLSPPDCWPAGA